MDQTAPGSARVRQLDALRGIAVVLVMAHHYVGWAHEMGLGEVGVQLFFVLSGFLITRILLELKTRRENGTGELKADLLAFHASRAARIWPVFFLTLLAVFLAGDRFERKEDMIWHALFASNFLFFMRGSFDSSLSHFWTLGVEQQFYLLWPAVVLLVPRSRLEIVIVALILLAPATRLALVFSGSVQFAEFNTLPFANFDSLGIGALVGLYSKDRLGETDPRWRVLSYLAVSAAILLVLLHLTPAWSWPGDYHQTLLAFIFAWLVAKAFKGFSGVTGRTLEWGPLVWLGVISYAIYVYHMFTLRIAGWALRGIDAPLFLQHGVPLILFSIGLTIAAAGISWLILEKPILEWRRRSRVEHVGREALSSASVATK